MISDILAIAGWIGLVAFAVSGALVASRKQMDVIAFVFFGTATAIGGGTMRDLVLDLPVFWVKDTTALIVAAIASALTFFVAHLPQSRLRLLLWLDALGMAVFCVVGAAAGLDHGAVVAVTCGVITAVVGGFIRDMMGAEEAAIMRGEIYASAAFLGALIFVLLHGVVARDIAVIAGTLAAFALRGAALAFGWRLAVYRAKRGRSREEIGL
ncbi:MAG: trimeric intracellular cation channel family protein [Methylobacterium sp.]|nr:trimeric intracellular cation channel family protein [Methylobacterium sp.]